jgi:hypothetical protein
MENKCRIEIKVTDLDYNTSTSVDKTIQLYPDMGWECTFQGEFASLINKFMDLLGYPNFNKDSIILESVTLEEYDRIIGFLDKIRNPDEYNEE